MLERIKYHLNCIGSEVTFHSVLLILIAPLEIKAVHSWYIFLHVVSSVQAPHKFITLHHSIAGIIIFCILCVSFVSEKRLSVCLGGCATASRSERNTQENTSHNNPNKLAVNLPSSMDSSYLLSSELSLGMELDFDVDCGSPPVGLCAPRTLEELVDFLEIGKAIPNAVDIQLGTTFGTEDRWPI